jgi:valyl-tRNA synthetase
LPGADTGLLHQAYAGASATIMLTAYPQSKTELIDDDAEWEMQAVIDLISRVRNIRSEMNIKPGERIPILIGSPDERSRQVFSSSIDQVARLARASGVSISDRLNAPQASARAVLAGGAEVAVPLEGLIDFEQERQRLQKELDKLQGEASKLEAQLSNANFVDRAPEEKVSEVRARITDIGQRSAQLKQTIENLQ